MALIRGMMMARMATRVNQSDGKTPNHFSPPGFPDSLDHPVNACLME